MQKKNLTPSTPVTILTVANKWMIFSSSFGLSAETVNCLLCHLRIFHLCLSARCGGTVGAILTCPLEVVKTRLQSSSITLYVSGVQLSTVNGASVARVSPPGPLHCLKWVLNNICPSDCLVLHPGTELLRFYLYCFFKILVLYWYSDGFFSNT